MVELEDELRAVKSRFRQLLREVRGEGGASSSRAGDDRASVASGYSGRDSRDEHSAGSFSLVQRSFDENASRSRSDLPPSPSPAPTTPSVASVASSRCPLTWLEREAICDEIGQYVRRALSGEHRGQSGRDCISLSSRVWLVFSWSSETTRDWCTGLSGSAGHSVSAVAASNEEKIAETVWLAQRA